jgi:hypothetical protein
MIFPFPKASGRALKPTLLVNGYRDSLSWVKSMGREFDHSSPSSVEIKNEWSSSSTPPTCVDKDKVTFTLLLTQLSFDLVLGE